MLGFPHFSELSSNEDGFAGKLRLLAVISSTIHAKKSDNGALSSRAACPTKPRKDDAVIVVVDTSLLRRSLSIFSADRGCKVHRHESDWGSVFTSKRDRRVSSEAMVVAEPRNYPLRVVGVDQHHGASIQLPASGAGRGSEKAAQYRRLPLKIFVGPLLFRDFS